MRKFAHSSQRLSQVAGEQFQQFLEAYVLTALLGHGHLRHFVRIEPRVKVLRELGEGRFEGVHTARAAADYVAMTHSGRYLAFEAKSVAEDRFYRNELRPQQEAHLDAAGPTGGAFLFVQLRAVGRMYCVPWPAQWERRKSADSLGAGQLEPYRFTHWHQLVPLLKRSDPNPSGEPRRPDPMPASARRLPYVNPYEACWEQRSQAKE